MATLILYPNADTLLTVKSIINNQSKKTYSSLSEIVDFCTAYNIVDECYVVQVEDEEEYNIRISMQEIKAVYNEGECPEDLDFF